MDPILSKGENQSRSFFLNGKIMLSAIVILFAVVIIILFLHLYVRWHVLRRASRHVRRHRRLILAGEIQLPPPSGVNLPLDPSILKSLPVLLFSSSADGVGDGEELLECAVCLNEFEEGDKIRCLPQCGHGFHIDCIDMWFCSHSTCPLCRAQVESVKEAETPKASMVSTDDPPVMTGDSARPDLCLSCWREEDMGSSSSNPVGREVRIQVPASSLGSYAEQSSLGFESREQQALKLSSSRIFFIWWLLIRRIHGSGSFGSVPDLESGNVAFRQPPAPSPASTADI